MPTDKSFRKVQGGSSPSQKGAEYAIKRYPVPGMHETAKAPKGQARSPKPQHLGATRGVGAGGKKVPPMGTTKHTRAMGIEST